MYPLTKHKLFSMINLVLLPTYLKWNQLQFTDFDFSLHMSVCENEMDEMDEMKTFSVMNVISTRFNVHITKQFMHCFQFASNPFHPSIFIFIHNSYWRYYLFDTAITIYSGLLLWLLLCTIALLALLPVFFFFFSVLYTMASSYSFEPLGLKSRKMWIK